MLSDLASVRTFLRVNPTDDSVNPLLSHLLAMSDRCVKQFCKQNLETEIRTDFEDGNNATDLALKEKFVHATTTTGTVSQGSAVVTNIPSTAKLLVGMPVTSQLTTNPTTAIPNNTVILSIDSVSQVTLSQPAGVSGQASPLAIGIAVWWDPLGYGGQRPGGFGPGSLLVLGYGFQLIRDQRSGASRSAVIRRIGYAWTPGWSGFGTYGSGGSGGYGRRGGLTARLPPTWGNTWQGIKIVYASGVAEPGGHGIPPELTMCVNAITGWMRAMTPAGVPIDASGITAQVSAQLAYPTPSESSELGTVRNILRRYKDMSI